MSSTPACSPPPPARGRMPLVRGLASLTRPGTCVSGAIICAVGAGLAGGGGSATTVAAALSIALAIAFAQVVNDIVDLDLDRVDKPERPLPSGAVSRGDAVALAVACAAGALAAALAIDAAMGGFALALLVASWAYSVFLKGTVLVGNVVVAALASSCATYGAAASGRVTALVASVQLSVFVFSLAFEVLKTGRDMRGDARAGIETVATRAGPRRTALLAAGLCVAAAAVALLPALLAPRPLPYLAAMGVCGIAPALLCAYRLVRRGRTAADLRDALGVLRVAWCGGVISFLALL